MTIFFCFKFLCFIGVTDPLRVVASGGSHGGFLTGHLVGQFPERFRCGVLQNPVMNLSAMVYTTDIPDWVYVESLGTKVGVSSCQFSVHFGVALVYLTFIVVALFGILCFRLLIQIDMEFMQGRGQEIFVSQIDSTTKKKDHQMQSLFFVCPHVRGLRRE